MPPETRYARSGDVHIAYQVVGEGPVDVVYIPPGMFHVEHIWDLPPQARFLSRLASISRLLLFDKRGTGMSDRVVGTPTLETRIDDIRAVMDAAGSEHALLLGAGDAGPLCALLAATYPERTIALVLFNSAPRFVRSPDLPSLPAPAEQERRLDEILRRWGEPAFHEERLKRVNPSATAEERQSTWRVFRLSVSPGAAADYYRMFLDVDVRDVLPSVHAPTLVIYRTDVADASVRSTGRYMAERIPRARLVELPGRDVGAGFGDADRLFAELEAFLAEVVEEKPWQTEPDRVLATVLFTDIVGSTAKAAELGDMRWRELLEQHHTAIRRELSRFRGREIDTIGDGFFASFDGPARAIRCACAITDAVKELGLEVRAGLHTGECELVDEKVAGIAVHTGARVAAKADPGEVLVSSTVKDLVAGSGLAFEDRGAHELRGIPGEWRLYSLVG